MSRPEPFRESCARCGDDVSPGSALYLDRVVTDARIVCRECWRAERGHVTPLYPEPDMPNTNLPQTH